MPERGFDYGSIVGAAKLRQSRTTCFAFALGATILAFFPNRSHADCGFDGVTIVGTATEIADGCRALSGVLGYFSRNGFSVEPHIKIVFKERVFVDLYDAQTLRIASRAQVSGFYDAQRMTVEIASASSPFQRDRKPWGIKWGREIAYSILQHELAHSVTHQILGTGYSRAAKAWLEFIAYSVQFEIMTPELRGAILQANPGINAFDRPEHVNDMIYGFNPDLFGLRAYLFTQASGGREFIRKIIAGEVTFETAPLWTR